MPALSESSLYNCLNVKYRHATRRFNSGWNVVSIARINAAREYGGGGGAAKLFEALKQALKGVKTLA